MRLFVSLILIGLLLTGCGLLRPGEDVESRINTALPPGAGVQAARQILLEQMRDQPDAQKVLEPLWAARLRLRALSCSPDYIPTAGETNADVVV